MISVGKYLGSRIVEAGCTHVFGVAGDYNLSLLGELNTEPGLQLVSTCNELNGGYAADGFARGSQTLAVLVVTYMVGSLSALNAVAGAYSEDIPLLVVCCAPSLHDYSHHRIMHHTTGEPRCDRSAECYAPIVAQIFTARHLEDAAAHIDSSIKLCISKRKPVYLEMACDLALMQLPIPSAISFACPDQSDACSLSAAVEDAVMCLFASQRPVLLGGSKAIGRKEANVFAELAEGIGCGVAVMPGAKGMFDETHAQYIGCYWGSISGAGTQEIVESADLLISCGAIFNDGTSVGWTTLLKPLQTIRVEPNCVMVCGRLYSDVRLVSFLSALAKHVPQKTASLDAFLRYRSSSPTVSLVDSTAGDGPLTRKQLVTELQGMLTSSTALLVESGDAWFIGDELHLPSNAHYHVQMQYGSIGWSVGAMVGLTLAYKGKRDVLAIIGDGSFQMSAQELSTCVRLGLSLTVVLLNNAAYGIEVALHDGPYNYFQNWSYAKLLGVFSNGDPNANVHGFCVNTRDELQKAISVSADTKGVCLIECCLQRDDCSAKLLCWGSHVAAADMAPPSS